MKGPRYVVTTPVRNERELLPSLVAAMDALEPLPGAWFVVDDGSTDGSREWLERAAESRPWMGVGGSPEPATEYLGGHVARVKRHGLERAREFARSRGEPATYAGILDADILVPKDHYARLVSIMEADRDLGITSSIIASPEADGTARPDRFQRSDEPRGGTQFFRVDCLDALGGLPPWPGYDGAANVMARARGFRTQLVTDLVATQQREMAARFGVEAGYERRGRYAWFLGVNAVLAAGRAAAYAVTVSPGAGYRFAKGWAGEAARLRPRCPDPDVRAQYGWKRLAEVSEAVLGRGRAYVKR